MSPLRRIHAERTGAVEAVNPWRPRGRSAAAASLRSATLLLVLACASPQIDPPVTGLFHEDPADNPEGRVLLSVTGSGFGTPETAAPWDAFIRDAFVRIVDARGDELLTASASDAEIVHLWSERQIVLTVPEELITGPGTALQVCAPGGASAAAEVASFRYEHYDVPRSDLSTNPLPLALAVDPSGAVWLNEEFHTQIKRLSPRGGWSVVDVPQAGGAGIFASTLFGDDPTRIATLGEQVLVDPRGRIWFSESGEALYGGEHANRARILMVDPSHSELQVFNVPGDNGGVIGLAWDPEGERLWFTQARRFARVGQVEYVAQEARLTSFDPSVIPSAPLYDFPPVESCERPAGETLGTCSISAHRRCIDDRDCVLAHQVCAPGGSDDRACFREHELPPEFGVYLPGHLLHHSDGTLWYAAYWGGNHVGRFDPATGLFQRYPLARPAGESSCSDDCGCFASHPAEPECPERCCLYRLLGQGPWMLAEEPGGDVVFTAQEGGGVSRVDYARRDDPQCQALDASGRNPCIASHAVPGFDPERLVMHSLARDADENLWVSLGPTPDFASDPESRASLGLLEASTGPFVLLPPLSLYPYTSSGRECTGTGEPVAFSGAGVAFDPEAGAIWFADFCRKRVGRIAPLRR
jgi:streptogramin lyase